MSKCARTPIKELESWSENLAGACSPKAEGKEMKNGERRNARWLSWRRYVMGLDHTYSQA
ncbi:hypothetical protein GX48_04134 [Paracoccidioides brasiliensis]|nr:hypothetical protein GX48_04134 [Paracoccidioides brasiliensis]